MTNFEFIFFCTYLGIQLTLPFKRHIYVYLFNFGQCYFLGDAYHRFTWSLVLISCKGVLIVTIFDKKTKQIICSFPPDIFLTKEQVGHVILNATSLLDFSNFLKDLLEDSGMTDYGIRLYLSAQYNDNEAISPVDPRVDFTEESRHYFTPYPWLFYPLPKSHKK